MNADRPDSWLNIGVLEARLGNISQAEAAYQRAIHLQPDFIPSYVNLADVCRAQQREADAERVLREAIAPQPDAPVVHHALGLLLVRRNRHADAVSELSKAAALSPEMPRYTFIYALALDRIGQRAKAIATLENAQRRFSGDRDILVALVDLSTQAGDQRGVHHWGQKLQALGLNPR